MKATSFIFTAFAILTIALYSCNDQPAADEKGQTAPVQLKEESITYMADTVTMNGYVVYNENDTAKRPVVLIIHEWWGLNDYPKMRARELAQLGYLAMAVDMYGNGKTVDNPEDANNMSTPFYQDPQMAKSRFDAALRTAKGLPLADTGNIAAIGYCFGGGLVLNFARLGEDLDGVVSFHGSLVGTPANKDLLKAKVLVCHGADDSFVAPGDLETFKKQMDSIGADYTVKVYPNATHAFTNPAATETGKKFNIPIAYNAAADTASWKDMQDFFGRIFH